MALGCCCWFCDNRLGARFPWTESLRAKVAALLGSKTVLSRFPDKASKMSRYFTAPGHFSPKIVRLWEQSLVASRVS